MTPAHESRMPRPGPPRPFDSRRRTRRRRTTAARRPGSVAPADRSVRGGSFHHGARSRRARNRRARAAGPTRRWIASMYIPRCRPIRRRTAISYPTPPSEASCDCSWRGSARSVDCSRPCTGNSPSPPWVVPMPPAIESPDFLGLGYEDVRAAWRYYLAHDNGNRGIVLIGHSQGTVILTELIRREIEGTPVQSRIVSALAHRRTGRRPRASRADSGRHVSAPAGLPRCHPDRLRRGVFIISLYRTAGGEHALRTVRPTRHSSRPAPIPRRSAAARPPSTAISTRREQPPCRWARRSVDRRRTTHCDAHGACGGAVEGAVQVQRVRLVSRGVGTSVVLAVRRAVTSKGTWRRGSASIWSTWKWPWAIWSISSASKPGAISTGRGGPNEKAGMIAGPLKTG